VAIVGSGLIGSAWAVMFARSGYQVRVTRKSAETRGRFFVFSLLALVSFMIQLHRNSKLNCMSHC
jgi:2-polyprenyl-6-methoxyphenol hydroxylase-like FAD-dependent oxidoreductase